MPTYSAADIIGKTLIAKKDVIVYYSYPNSSLTKIIGKGGNIGKVYSFVLRNNNKDLYWQVVGKDGVSFYVLHKSDSFDLPITEKAVLKSEEKKAKEIKEEQQKNTSPVEYYINKYGKKIIIAAGVIIIGKTLIQQTLNNYNTKTAY